MITARRQHDIAASRRQDDGLMAGAPGSLSVREILGGAFGVVRSRPGAVLVWALIYGAAMAAFTFTVRAGLRIQPELQGGGDPNALAPAGTSLLVSLVFLILFIILLTAAMRSVLRPSEPGIAFLRFGMDELRQIGLCLFFLILFYVGLIIVGIGLGLIIALVIASAGTGAAMVVAITIGAAILLVLITWLSVRLSLSVPLTLIRGTITISESWRLTRGRFWTLLGGFLPLYLLLMILSLGAAAVTMGDYWTELARGGFTLQSLRAASEAQLAQQLGPIDAMMILGWVLSDLGAAITFALQGGALATAARQLADVRAGMAETFA
jgi:hypothetical protein